MHSLIAKVKPEPATEREVRAMELLLPGDYEVYSEKITTILEEARVVFVRTGVSSMLHSGDLVVGVHTPAGDLVAASCGTLLHTIPGQLVIKWMMEKWKDNPTVGIREGDIFYGNEGAMGAVHNPDQVAFMPIFHDGELVAWAAAGTHQPETGAVEPGGMPISARSRYYEGMHLSPIKIGENYQLKDDLLWMMGNMMGRAPRMQLIDTRARATGADRIRRRVQELAAEKGNEFLTGLFRKMIASAETGARRRIAKLNDGVYRHVWILPTVGYKRGLLRAFMTLTKRGEELHFDLTGTSPENDGSYNAFTHIALAHACIYLFEYLFPDLPVNAGALASIEFTAPDGCFLNADASAAISNSPVACSSVMNLVPVVMAKCIFDSELRSQVSANQSNTGAGYIYAGLNQWGVPVADIHSHPLNTEGDGARPDRDGVDSFGFPWGPWGTASDAEDTENEAPFFHLFQRHTTDSGGYGKYRGGAGTESAMVVHHGVPYLVCASLAKGSLTLPTCGLFGGYSSPCLPGINITENNLVEMMASGSPEVPFDLKTLVRDRAVQGSYSFENNLLVARPFKVGDIFVTQSVGGGGYGDILERDPEAVAKDLRKGLVSHKAAREVYKVVYDEKTLEIDHAATARQRDEERAARRQRGRSYDEFVAEWSTRQPPAEILEFYGTWPEAQPNRPLMRI